MSRVETDGLRIGLVTSSFLPNVGGIEWKVHFLATEYERRGHRVVVFAGRPTSGPSLEVMPANMPYRVIRCGYPWPGTGRLGVARWFFRRAILTEHRRSPLDVLHCHHLGSPTRYGLDARSRVGVPVVATTCGGDLQIAPEIGYGVRLQPRFDRLVRENVKQVDVVGSISEAIREELLKIGTKARIVDIPNGVPWDSFQIDRTATARRKMDVADEAFVVLSVGRNHPVKGYDLGLRAFASMSREFPQAIYVLVGRDVTTLLPLVRELDIESRVRLIEERPFSELPAIFRSADMFFSPSLMEGFSQVNAQALASGVPCVVTDAPGNRDAAIGGGALVARTRDISSMAECLARVIRDPGKREELASAAHRVGQRYAWSRIAGEYLALFGELDRRN